MGTSLPGIGVLDWTTWTSRLEANEITASAFTTGTAALPGWGFSARPWLTVVSTVNRTSDNMNRMAMLLTVAVGCRVHTASHRGAGLRPFSSYVHENPSVGNMPVT